MRAVFGLCAPKDQSSQVSFGQLALSANLVLCAGQLEHHAVSTTVTSVTVRSRRVGRTLGCRRDDDVTFPSTTSE